MTLRYVSSPEIPEGLAVRIEELSLRYKINVESKMTLKNAIMRAGRGEKRQIRTIEAVKNLSLDIPHGTVVGVVGARYSPPRLFVRS